MTGKPGWPTTWSEPRPLTGEGGQSPRFAPDGRRIYYVDLERKIRAVELDASGAPRSVSPAIGADWSHNVICCCCCSPDWGAASPPRRWILSMYARLSSDFVPSARPRCERLSGSMVPVSAACCRGACCSRPSSRRLTEATDKA